MEELRFYMRKQKIGTEMNAQEKQFFEKLSAKRQTLSSLLHSFALRGVEKSVVEKYSDEAHFIYELLQNADDAGASKVRFILYDDHLLFIHNGTRHFTISDPDEEDKLGTNNKIGDINSITAIGASNKHDQSTIGKFGVGFKAVFQYTKTPHIYDSNFWFKIENFLVPKLLDCDHSERGEEETLFAFPFDRDDHNFKECFADIESKLSSLDYPLLFLCHLQSIDYYIGGKKASYVKNIERSLQFQQTQAQLINLVNTAPTEFDKESDERIWIFSRAVENNILYCIGFFINNEGGIIKRSFPAFCFFPTKERTNLNFIIHAPFLLTDSREGIRAGENHNQRMIFLLAQLAADSLEYLRDIGCKDGKRIINDDIIDFIPYDAEQFEPRTSKRMISFMPFYENMLDKFKHAEIIPTHNGYTRAEHAYWADEPQIAALFSDSQLAQIVDDSEAKWAFPSRGRQNTIRNKNAALRKFVDEITCAWLDETKIMQGGSFDDGTQLCGLDEGFIESQPLPWLDKLYAWILESKYRTDLIRDLPIFLDSNNNAVAIYDNDIKSLFQDSDPNSDFTTINKNLLIFESARELLKRYDVGAPSIKDIIFTKILPLYDDDEADIDVLSHFKTIFSYYKDASINQRQNLVEKLINIPFLLCTSSLNEISRSIASKIYLKNTELESWFINKDSVLYLMIEEYEKIIDDNDKDNLYDFFLELGVSSEPRILKRSLPEYLAMQIQQEWPHTTRYKKWIENYIDGAEELLTYIEEKQDIDKSLMLWHRLSHLIQNGLLNKVRMGVYEYFYRWERSTQYQTSFFNKLFQSRWIVNINNIFVSPEELNINTINKIYLTNDYNNDLCTLLDISPVNDDDNSGEQNESYENTVIDCAKALGLSEDEHIRALVEFANKKLLSNKKMGEDVKSELDHEQDNNIDGNEDDVLGKAAKKIKKIRDKQAKQNADKKQLTDRTTSEGNEDTDEYTPPIASIDAKIAKVKQDAVRELAALEELGNLHKKIVEASTCTFGWLRALLELESNEIGNNCHGSREISIDFGKVEREEGTERTLILKHPSRYIPQMMEDLADIPLELDFIDGSSMKLAIEVINVKSYTLKVKIRQGIDIANIAFSHVVNAHIEAQSPAFLFGELKKSIIKLAEQENWQDDYNLRDNLCKDLEFVFGPPGTGKSTWLAKYIIDLLNSSVSKITRILVLAPTNKAADVLVNRILEHLPEGSPLTGCLVRFGVTGDIEIEKKGILKPKSFDIRKLPTNITVTTIARFPYDYFLLDESTRLPLNVMDWDYIIIDEASMIHLPYIIYPLYKSHPKKFVIAGDPFQIQPISSIDTWKDENIYTLIGLNSFSNPTTYPIAYPVHCLTTQYRAVPQIGEIFSQLTYDGVLSHNRMPDSGLCLPSDDLINIATLNIVKFPVRKYESIYRAQRLKSSSPYHIYSALFSFEMIKYLIKQNWQKTTHGPIRIGVIAPYRAQADIVAKLVEGATFPEDFDIQVGTIHGFQGDECEIILALFNPPPHISASESMFLNKGNIINVAISRAKDFLFILLPDDDTESRDSLYILNKLELLCTKQGCNIINTFDVENIILGSSTYLEDNSFATSHHDVNVYRKPERKYEVRCESTAIDLQINDDFI